MKVKKLVCSVLALQIFCLLTDNAYAAIVTVNFDDPLALGALSNGASVVGESNLVSFSDTIGGNLTINNTTSPPFLTDSGTQFLVVPLTDASALRMDFAQDIDLLSFRFGGDVLLGATARLRLFNGVVQVGSNIDVSLSEKPATITNLISTTGSLVFNRAEFQFVDAFGVGTNAIEAIDSLSFNTVAVPEPTFSIVYLGFAGAVVCLHRRRKYVLKDEDYVQ